MPKRISLTESEATLRQLLLDVSTYIGTLEGCTKPELRITGGWVRDKLLDSTSVDIDIGINTMTGYRFGTLMVQYLALPEAKAKYEQGVLGDLAKIAANPEKSKHLETVTTRILGFDIDLVNLRKEAYVEDSRNPTMDFGTPEEDALRRDATINALFYNLSTSEVEDFTGRGLQDIERKVIKTPLEPLQTFRDDPLRVLRAIRFSSRFGYQIADEDANAMSDSSIKAALRLKISRERVGVEVIKMLKGPNPHIALSLIDRIGLYNTVFTDPTDAECKIAGNGHWSRAYDQLSEIVKAKSESSDVSSSLQSVARILLRDSDDSYLAWVLACFNPWARETQKHFQPPKSKQRPSLASVAAREGIKAENRICKLVDRAVSHLPRIIAIKDSFNNHDPPTNSPLKGKQGGTSRETQGQAIRHWGSHWRSSVMYALLTQVAESETDTDHLKVLNEYAAWLSGLQFLDLLDVDQLKPIVNGNQISTALKIKDGPWLKKALDMTMDWQLRHPGETDGAGAIAEVMERKKELGIS